MLISKSEHINFCTLKLGINVRKNTFSNNCLAIEHYKTMFLILNKDINSRDDIQSQICNILAREHLGKIANIE